MAETQTYQRYPAEPVVKKRRKRLPNQTRWHAHARTLFYFIHRYEKKLIPVRPEQPKRDKFGVETWSSIERVEYTLEERVGTRNVKLRGYVWGRDAQGHYCWRWDKLASFEATVEFCFKDFFFWAKIVCDEHGENRRIIACMLGTRPNLIPVFEKMMRRYDGMTVMRRMIECQDNDDEDEA